MLSRCNKISFCTLVRGNGNLKAEIYQASHTPTNLGFHWQETMCYDNKKQQINTFSWPFFLLFFHFLLYSEFFWIYPLLGISQIGWIWIPTFDLLVWNWGLHRFKIKYKTLFTVSIAFNAISTIIQNKKAFFLPHECNFEIIIFFFFVLWVFLGNINIFTQSV